MCSPSRSPLGIYLGDLMKNILSRRRLQTPRTCVLFALTFVVLILASQWGLQAQVLYGTLTGNITDPTGAAVPNAKVEALNVRTGVAQNSVTNEIGVYRFTTLDPGQYTLTITAPSFGVVTQTGIGIRVNEVTRSDAQLKISGTTETVVVNAEVLALQTDRGDVHTDLSTKQLTDLPIAGSVGRNFEALLKLVPGVQPPAEQNSAAGNPERAMSFNVNGISRVNNNVTLDGASVIYAWLPYLVAYVPPQEAIEEVNVETNSFLPEIGTAGGSAVNVIIRSGTNDFHGAAWEYNTNTDFNARPFFFAAGHTVPKNILNQFGARMGGPIKHNKLFFFGDWERTLQRQSISGLATLPTDALKSGDFSAYSTLIYDPTTGNPNGTGRTPFPGNKIPGYRISPIVSNFVSLLPTPNLVGATPSNDYFGASSYAYTRDNADGKVSYHLNDNSQIFGRYSISKGTIADPFQFGAAEGGTWDGGQPGAAFVTVQNIAAGGTHTFSPTMLIDGNAGYDRQNLGAAAPDANTVWGQNGVPYIPGTNVGTNQGGIPYFNVQNGWSAFGNSNTGNPFQFRDNCWVGNLNFSWMKGAHQLRFGWGYTHDDMNHFQPQGGSFQTARGSFRFNGDQTALNGGAAASLYTSFADFLLGLPSEEGKAVQTVIPNALRWSTWSFYAQDQWQVSPKFTVTYGARYEFYPFVTRDHTGNYTFQPSTGNVLIGGENGIPEDTGIDVGWGFIAPRLGFAYRLNDRTVIRGGMGLSPDPDNWRDMRNTYPAFLISDYTAQTNYQSPAALSAGLPIIASPDVTVGTIKLPGNLSTQAVANPFRRGYIEAANLSVQRDLGWGFNWNLAYVGTHEVRQMSNVNINAGPAGGGSTGRMLYATTGNLTDINEDDPFGSTRYDALQSQFTRKVGTATVGVNYTYSRAMDMGDDSTYNGLTFAYPSYQSRNWAAAGYDRPQNLQIWSVTDLPFGKGHKYLQQGIGSWVLGGWQVNTIFSAASGTPFTITSSAALNGPGNTEVANQILPTVAIYGNVGPGQLWFNTSAYAAPATNTLGNTGRNSFRGPGFFELDGGLFRDFAVKERYHVQFRAESFSLTNTPIFANPSGSLGSSSFGQITGTAVSSNGVSTGGGNRIIRLALKLSF